MTPDIQTPMRSLHPRGHQVHLAAGAAATARVLGGRAQPAAVRGALGFRLVQRGGHWIYARPRESRELGGSTASRRLRWPADGEAAWSAAAAHDAEQCGAVGAASTDGRAHALCTAGAVEHTRGACWSVLSASASVQATAKRRPTELYSQTAHHTERVATSHREQLARHRCTTLGSLMYRGRSAPLEVTYVIATKDGSCMHA